MKSISIALALVLASAATAGAQDRAAVELSGAGWVNTPGLSLERLRGKIVLLYFFEET